jgi:hypothetical protein
MINSNNPTQLFKKPEVTKGTLVFLCGAGGTGKTVVAQEMEKTYGYTRMASPTRDFYKQEGVVNEIEFMNKPNQYRMEFHVRYGEYYRKHILNSIKSLEPCAFVVERSPICILAYTMYHSQLAPLAFLQTQQELVWTFLSDLIDDGWFVSIPFFVYPTPWAEKDDADGFRYTTGVKNFTVSALMLNLLRDTQPNVQRLHAAAILDGTPEERASGLVEELSNAITQAAG